MACLGKVLGFDEGFSSYIEFMSELQWDLCVSVWPLEAAGSMRISVRQTWLPLPAQSLPSYVIWGKLLNVLKSRVFYIK